MRSRLRRGTGVHRPPHQHHLRSPCRQAYILPLLVSAVTVGLLRIAGVWLCVSPTSAPVLAELLPVGDAAAPAEYVPVPESSSPAEPSAEKTTVPTSLRAASSIFPASVIAVWACGLCFGLSLGLSGMLDPSKVLRFLDFLGDAGWDPQLALVMGCGVATNIVLMRVMAVGVLSQTVPPFALALGGSKHSTLGSIINYGSSCPPNRVVNAALIGGSVLFGFGWGLTGVCPGPAVVDYITGGSQFGVTVPAMLLGMSLHGLAARFKLV